jgi:hypothetical protein
MRGAGRDVALVTDVIVETVDRVVVCDSVEHALRRAPVGAGKETVVQC